MPAIRPELRAKLLAQRREMRAQEKSWCPFDDDVLIREWSRSADLDQDDAMGLRRELMERARLVGLGRSTLNTTNVSVDKLVNELGYTRQRVKQLDDDGLLAVKWDNPRTRRKGYVLRVELDALPERMRGHAEEQARQRKLKNNYIGGRASKPIEVDTDELPECLR